MSGESTDPSTEGRQFDETWATETCAFGAGDYEPAPPTVIEAALDAIDEASSRFTFVDLGSGKGRAALLASRRPWLGVHGVEYQPALHEIAERNLAAFEARGGPVCEVALHCADAREVPLPSGPLVVFLYDPFAGPVLLQVLDRLIGREGWLVYVNPQHHTSVAELGFAAVDAEDHPEEDGWSWVLYRMA